MEDLGTQARALADGVDRALGPWVVASVERVFSAWAGAVPSDVREAAAEAGERARSTVGPAVRALLLSAVDDQRSTPLAIVRQAVIYPTEVLAAAGVPPVARDGGAEAMFGDDVYDLTPATLADLDPALGEVAMAWGAAKAWAHRRLHGGGS